MTKEELIRMAREAWYLNGENVPSWHELERFAALVAVHTAAKEREWMQDINKRLIAEAVAAEREACAKVCATQWSNVAEKMYGLECAAAIKARAQE